MDVGLLDDIITRGQSLNEEWITRNPTHWLTETYRVLHKKSGVFASTSCDLTAMMLRWQYSKFVDQWELLDEPVVFEDVYRKYPIFQVSIGEDCDNNEHIFTIVNECIVQSYYGAYMIEKNTLTPNIIRALTNAEISTKNYATITRSSRRPRGLAVTEHKKLRTYYWVPTVIHTQ